MKTPHFLTPLVLLSALLLTGCGAKVAAVPVVPEGARAGDLIGLKACEFQPKGSQTSYAAE